MPSVPCQVLRNGTSSLPSKKTDKLLSTRHIEVSRQAGCCRGRSYSRNIMMYGLQENKEEDLGQKVVVVFRHLREKTRIEAIRLGKDSLTGTDRPVKIALSSSVIVRQIFSKSKKMRETEEFKAVLLAPYCTVKEKKRQKELIVERKRNVAEDPNRRHYIRGKQCCNSLNPVK